jgi:dynein heavy chain
MVYVDPSDLGWEPYVETWLTTKVGGRLDEETRAYMRNLSKTFLAPGLRKVRRSMAEAMPQVDAAKVATFCCIFQELLNSPDAKVDWEMTGNDVLEVVLANIFFFSFVWAVGGNLQDKDWGKFDTYVRELFAAERKVCIPGEGTVYDYYVSFTDQTPTLENWRMLVPTFSYRAEEPFFNMLVPTQTTVKYSYLMEKLLLGKKPTLFTGTTGVGKSVIAKECLNRLQKTKNVLPISINFSAQTTSQRTQEIVESKLEKKRKNAIGAPNNKQIVIFVDDLNMPKLDTYGAQPPIELLRQFLDFGGLYDREKLFWKEIQDVNLAAACAPPGGGRNPVTPRFLRHFAMLSVPSPDGQALQSIFKQIVEGFFSSQGFSKAVMRAGHSIVEAAVEVYNRLSAELLPTPAKSHYVFNLRDLSKCIQGVLQANPTVILEYDQIWELFCHESSRVFHDRLINATDKAFYHNILAEVSARHFNKV